LESPTGVAADASGNIYISDFYNNAVRKVDTSGNISTLTLIDQPEGIAVDGSGNVYVASMLSNIVIKIDTSGNVTTVAGDYDADYYGGGGSATSAALNQPMGLAIDSSGNLYIADSSNNVIRRVNSSGIISTVAGNGTDGYTGDGGPATSATLGDPSDVKIDGSGNIYIADWYNNVIRRVSSSGTISTFAGNGSYGYGGDGGLRRVLH